MYVYMVVCVKLPQQHHKRVVPTADKIRPICYIEVYGVMYHVYMVVCVKLPQLHKRVSRT